MKDCFYTKQLQFLDKEELSENIQEFVRTFVKVYEEKGREDYRDNLSLLLSKTKPFSSRLYACRKNFLERPEGDFLYKYVRPEYAEQTLRDRSLFFSNPRKFNDLEDCVFREISMPARFYRDNGKHDSVYESYKEKARYLLSTFNGNVSDQDVLIEQIRSMVTSEDLDEDIAMARLNALLDYVGETYGPTRDNLLAVASKLKVCCLTDKFDDGKMWESYAEHSKGICIAIDWRKLECDSLTPYRVVYGGDYDFDFKPEKWTAKLFNNCTAEKVESIYYYLSAYAYFSVYHKRARYRKESEWRLVGTNERVTVDDAVAGVKLGSKMSEELCKSVEDIAKEKGIEIL